MENWRKRDRLFEKAETVNKQKRHVTLGIRAQSDVDR